jgi:hypothetical protein
MRTPEQLNGETAWGRQPRQQHRVYSVYSQSVAVQAMGGIPKILEMYEVVYLSPEVRGVGDEGAEREGEVRDHECGVCRVRTVHGQTENIGTL